MYEDDFDYWMDDWSVEMAIEESIIEKHERREANYNNHAFKTTDMEG